MITQSAPINNMIEIKEDSSSHADNSAARSPQNIILELPKREHSGKAIISAVSTGALVAGSGLGLFNHYGAQTAGTICNLIGFGLTQINDGVKNKQARNKIETNLQAFNDKKSTKVEGRTISLPTLSITDRYGLNQDGKATLANVGLTIFNTLLQLCVSLFLIGRIFNDRFNDENSQYSIDLSIAIPSLLLSALAVICDKVEQHVKQDNLQRYQALLDKGMIVLDDLNDVQQEPASLSITR